ncbi:MAG TPA: hypothetical protein VMT22_25045 [Terriglobales bacterium]|jgi:hypothetical protein|nr:hypothetical protein [Terriglobales bacterium]
MNVNLLAGWVTAALLGATACTPPLVAPLPQTVRRVAVLPPFEQGQSDAGAPDALAGLPSRTIGDLLAQQAIRRLMEKGFDVVAPGLVQTATKNRPPTSPQSAAQIMCEAHLDAAALFIDVRRWQPAMSGMKTDAIIVALDVMIVDPCSGAILWEAHRPSRPVPIYGAMLTGQANVFAAEAVMREIFH